MIDLSWCVVVWADLHHGASDVNGADKDSDFRRNSSGKFSGPIFDKVHGNNEQHFQMFSQAEMETIPAAVAGFRRRSGDSSSLAALLAMHDGDLAVEQPESTLSAPREAIFGPVRHRR